MWNELETPHIQPLPPQGYFEFLALMRRAAVIMTDSGGLQVEATHPQIRKPVLVLRTSTERPEAVIHRFARVVGTNPPTVLAELQKNTYPIPTATRPNTLRRRKSRTQNNSNKKT